MRSFRNLNSLIPEEHRETTETLVSNVEKIMSKDVNPFIKSWEKEHKMPLHSLFKIFGDNGLLGISHSERVGGFGLPYSVNLAVAEAFGKYIDHGSLPMALGVQTDMATPALAEHGSDYLIETYLKPAIAGDHVTCIGVSEPSAGSDVGNISSTAKISDCGKYYVVNGSKIWTTNVTQADWMCMLVNTETNESKYKNKSLIVMPLDLPGITISTKDMEKMGQKASDWGQSYFQDVRVPRENLIGKEGMGFYYQMQQFQKERLYGAASNIGILENAILKTIEYTSDRVAFGKPLIKNQFIAFKLAELMTEVEIARSAMYYMTERVDKGEANEFSKVSKSILFLNNWFLKIFRIRNRPSNDVKV